MRVSAERHGRPEAPENSRKTLQNFDLTAVLMAPGWTLTHRGRPPRPPEVSVPYRSAPIWQRVYRTLAAVVKRTYKCILLLFPSDGWTREDRHRRRERRRLRRTHHRGDMAVPGQRLRGNVFKYGVETVPPTTQKKSSYARFKTRDGILLFS